MPDVRHLLLRAFVVATLASVAVPLADAPARAATNITDRVRANENIELAGDATITLGEGEEIVYGGVISGVGTLTVTGRGKLTVTADSDFQIPENRRRQRLEILGEQNHPYATVRDPDPPAVTVEQGATLQYGDGTGGTTGRIGHYPYDYPNFAWNALNHRVDGTLIVAVAGPSYHPGILSGGGVLKQPRFIWDGVELAGDHPFSGTIVDGTFAKASSREQYRTSLPNAKFVNYGTFQVDTPHDYDTVLGFDVWSREWGNDINFYGAPDGSRVIMSGVYSWSDQGTETDPRLSDAGLNWRPVPKNINKRGVNIQGAIVQWGDGTHNRFFLPGTRETIYINLYSRRARGHLIFDYNGPVTLGAPISGGVFHDTMAAVAVGDVTVAGTPGNDVTFADQQNYDGTTTIERKAKLRLGTGKPGEDSWLITGTAGSRIVDNGKLVVHNAKRAVELSKISGTGSFQQAGPAPVRFTGDVTYTGRTTVSGGKLVLAGGSLASSSGVRLTKPRATLDIGRAGDQTVKNLSGVAGSAVRLGDSTLTVKSTKDTTFAGAARGGGGLVKAGTARLTYSGTSNARGPWEVAAGTLVLKQAKVAGDLVVDTALGVSGPVAVGGDVTLRQTSTLQAGTGSHLEVGGDVALAGAELSVGHEPGAALPQEIPIITSRGRVKGTFAGLDQGDPVDVGGTAYEITYTDRRVLLSTSEPTAATAENGTVERPSARWMVYLAIGLATAALAVIAFLVARRRRRTPPPHDADRS
ncbi:hypothetical protein ACIA03_21520 [Nocardioides sp. NPDC051685]|uniref:hypothetical protein n=1 Tax=Nocardioides sp. NPDC051685 TaxID=3364334 RepID=UPI003796D0DE